MAQFKKVKVLGGEGPTRPRKLNGFDPPDGDSVQAVLAGQQTIGMPKLFVMLKSTVVGAGVMSLIAKGMRMGS